MNDLSGTETEYADQKFESLDYRNRVLHLKEFYGCAFKRCSFVETTFQDCRFSNCTFTECDLSLIHVHRCSFTQTRFERSKMMGINWTEASWSGKGYLKTIDFSDCLISHSTFIGLRLRGLNMTGCTARNVDLSDADLRQANCRGTDFADSRFSHTDLTGADLTGARNYTIDATLNVLKNTQFSLPEAMSLLYSLDIILTE